MKYKAEILSSFKSLGFVPRLGQIEAVNLILTEFIDNKKTDVCLTASTGSGKSIIGVVVPEALNLILGGGHLLRSTIGMHQNSLVEQYADTFSGHDTVMQMKGANNYNCSVMSSNAEHCISSSLYQMSNSKELVDNHCNKCEFNKLKKRRNLTEHFITNYSYIFVDRMLSGVLDPRLCYVWDEAHLLNEVFTDHNTIYVSIKRITDFISDIKDYSTLSSKLSIELMNLLSQLKGNKVTSDNYIEFISTLQTMYNSTKCYFENKMEDCIKRGEFTEFKLYSNLAKKYSNLCCKISDLLSYKYEHVFDLNTDLKEFSIKAIFIGDMFNVLRNSKYNLFMSATLTEDFINMTMKLNPKTTAFIRLPSTFPQENKKVLFVRPLLSLNYKSMQTAQTINAIQKAVTTIVAHHDKLNESGVIFVPSFKVCEIISAALRKNKSNMKIFEHKQGEKAIDIVNSFKNYSGKGVLISPSIFEGVNLNDDISRFQIITKVPFPNLSDKRIKYILDKYPLIYQTMALYKLVQCLGRSTRSETDYSTSYILDNQGYNLLTNESNIWFDEFQFSYVDIKYL